MPSAERSLGESADAVSNLGSLMHQGDVALKGIKDYEISTLTT